MIRAKIILLGGNSKRLSSDCWSLTERNNPLLPLFHAFCREQMKVMKTQEFTGRI